jgi:2-keto-4-pentenoate hydratase/2-oxohepta-3-ene-1,7-dioic acid hydratase in catechol pathway
LKALSDAKHELTHYAVAETGKDTPPHPSLFIKPSTAVGDYGGDIPIPKICQDGEADYEIELCAVIGKAAKNVSREEALDYVAGFTVGNDVSARKWQALSSRAGTSPQWCFGKVGVTN